MLLICELWCLFEGSYLLGFSGSKFGCGLGWLRIGGFSAVLFWFACGVALGCLIIGGWMLIWCSLLTMSGLLFVGCEFDFWSGFVTA